jgi:uncharacterized protein (DUF433 family)
MDPATPAGTSTPPAATPLPVIAEHIGVRPGHCGGRPHILGHRIKVQHVAAWHEQMGMSPAEIVATYPDLTLAQVHAALAYYYDHRAEIDAHAAEDDEFVERMRAEAGPSKLKRALEARRAGGTEGA